MRRFLDAVTYSMLHHGRDYAKFLFIDSSYDCFLEVCLLIAASIMSYLCNLSNAL